MAKKSNSRHHHWIPQYYLKNFTTSGLKTSKLQVYDVRNDRWFLTIPRNVGGKRDFNKVNLVGHPNDILENKLSELESNINDAILSVESNNSFSGESKTWILNFIALLAVRNPKFRKQRVDFDRRVYNRIMSTILSSEEMFEGTFQRAQESGYISANLNADYEQLKQFHQKGEYDWDIPRERLIEDEFELHDTILQTLGQRGWMLLCIDSKNGTFVSCDHPVSLREKSMGTSQGPKRLGFGLSSSAVLFPLTKTRFLIGEYGIADAVQDISVEVGARLNTETIVSADRQVFSSDKNYYFYDHSDQSIKTGCDLHRKVING